MRNHTSLIAWQVAREIVSLTLSATTTHWRPAKKTVFDQLQRAALSVQLNIAEGYARATWGAFRGHLRIAYASAVEVTELAVIAKEHQMLPASQCDSLLQGGHRCQALLMALIKKYPGANLAPGSKG